MALTTKPNPTPDPYRRITPCLIVQGGDKALKFYAEVFEATERMRFPNPDSTVAYAEMGPKSRSVIRSSLSRSSPPNSGPTRRDREGYIIDPFGHGRTIATHVADVEPAEMMRRRAEMQGV